MAKVYTGKVVIPGDKIDEYLSLMQEAEELREPFRQLLFNLCDDFASALEKKYVKKTVRKHIGVIELFIDFICRYTEVQNISDISKGMVNTQFRQWWKRKVWDSTSESEIRVALKKFFVFLAEEKNIINMTALNALRR